jgi:F0F1-type ATP synthase membrane subunit b/b'
MHVSLWSVGFQIVNFIVLALLLRRFLYAPVRRAIEKRKAEIDARYAEADAKKKEADEAAAAYRAKLATAEADAEHERARLLAEAEKRAAAIHDDTERKAHEIVERTRAALDAERAEALRMLEARAGEVAAAIAERLLADIAPDTDEVFLARATAKIDGLEASRKIILKKELVASGAEVVSAHALDQRARTRFDAWVTSLAGQEVPTKYAVDPSLIAGVELRFAHDVWRFNWRSSLARVRSDLRGTSS